MLSNWDSSNPSISNPYDVTVNTYSCKLLLLYVSTYILTDILDEIVAVEGILL